MDKINNYYNVSHVIGTLIHLIIFIIRLQDVSCTLTNKMHHPFNWLWKAPWHTNKNNWCTIAMLYIFYNNYHKSQNLFTHRKIQDRKIKQSKNQKKTKTKAIKQQTPIGMLNFFWGIQLKLSLFVDNFKDAMQFFFCTSILY